MAHTGPIWAERTRPRQQPSQALYQRISYTHEAGAPRYPGNPENRTRALLSCERGDACNAFEVTLFTHNGTHIDFPNHYHACGRRLADYRIEELVFHRPILVQLEASRGQAVTAAMLRPFEQAVRGKDLILLRTGFCQRRGTPAYGDHPYLSLDAARWLRGLRGLRAFGVDCLSVSNPRWQDVGDEVHRILLDEGPDRKPILILEDLDLSAGAIIGRFQRVFAVPLFVDGVDGMPCTVFGELEVSDTVPASRSA